MSYLQRIVVSTLTFISLAVIFPNMIFVNSIWTAVVASFVLSVLNLLIRPFIMFFSIPITLLTFGLFTFVINALILQMTSFFVGAANFSFSSFGSALVIAVIMSFVNIVVSKRNFDKNH
ncbi:MULTISPECIES: phage holin family protein [Enterococcus]|uniref:Phage holin family protein n=1 Tax=Candidatus Enterococcus mangumiae TaxID=2230878 RepID=A0ABZ2SS36_9ENTE|nr:MULTISPECIES: phage holin family protein [unclassified Enterococcus]MBO0460677.1 phage holin family protein [Enterococcus sp. DIV1298c]MBO0488852.1 phage holin family protein [Enterococcus sp. DIV1094]MBO1301198.1 phage holin family protein [Enterococcus sp. DIV1271a]